MPARRLPPKHPREKPWILQEPEAPPSEPLPVTCPVCGGQALLTDHACPHCGQVFFERRPGKAAEHKEPLPAHAPDPAIAEFAARVDRTEKWTRVLCVIGGLLSGFLFLASVFGLGGLYTNFYADVLLLLLTVVCLVRGLGRPGADLGFLSGVGEWMPWRRR